VNPGSLKTYGFKNGVLTRLGAIQPGDGMKFGPRHLDFHTTQPWVYVSIESQNKLYVYKRDPATGLSRDPAFIKETLADPKAPARQSVGTVHVHPNGRFVYVINRRLRDGRFRRQEGVRGRRELDRGVLDQPDDGRAHADPERRRARHPVAHLRDRPERSHAGRGQHHAASGA
jgi:hypothetical protein